MGYLLNHISNSSQKGASTPQGHSGTQADGANTTLTIGAAVPEGNRVLEDLVPDD